MKRKIIFWALSIFLLTSFVFTNVRAADEIMAESSESAFQRYKLLVDAGKIEAVATAKSNAELQASSDENSYIWVEDFEGDFPGEQWFVVGDEFKDIGWGKVTTHAHSGGGALYSGSSTSPIESWEFYEDEVQLISRYAIHIPGGLNVKWAKLEFYLDLVMPSTDFYIGAFKEGSVVLYYYVAQKNGPTYFGQKVFNTNTDGYQKQIIDLGENINVANIRYVNFFISSFYRRDVAPLGFGAWIDDIRVIATRRNVVAADFEASPLAGKAPLEVTFCTDHEAAPDHFLWDFGDGETLRYHEQWNARTPQAHVYTEPGEYDVTFTCWNDVWDDTMIIPNMVYVDSVLDYCEMTLIKGGKTYPGEGWENVLDHDLLGQGCMVGANRYDAKATFKTADEETKLVSKIRLLNDVCGERQWRTNCAKDVRLSLSETGDFDGEEVAVEYTCTGLRGVWDEVDVTVDDEPVPAKYLKVEILSSMGDGAKYRELVEMQVMVVDPDTGEVAEEPGEPTLSGAKELPKNFNILSNYPNPFNPETTIRFHLEKASEVVLSVYNIRGQLVKTLMNAELAAGAHNVLWDARDAQGLPVAGGVYIYKLQVRNDEQPMQYIQKMMLMK